MADEKLRDGIAAYKAGNKILARQLLSEAVNATPNSETAWLWLSACVETDEQKKYCLNRALSINPENQSARTALARLEQPAQPSIDDIGHPAQATPAKRPAKINTKVSWGNKTTPLTWIVLVGLVGVLIVVGLVVIAVIFLSKQSGLPLSIATNVPKPSLSCQLLTQDYLGKIQPLIGKFSDTLNVANSTSRIALAPVIQNMQEIQRNAAAVEAPACAQPASRLGVGGMDGVNNSLIDFMGNVSDIGVSRKMSQGLQDIMNGGDQLKALASGQTTPVPRQLPTDTPIPTPLPTPTPLPMANSFVINDSKRNPWQITVTKILVAQSLKATYSNSEEKASGRFAILFLEITNKGLSPETFVAFGTLNIKDASGNLFQENVIGSTDAQDLYGADICANINPDETKNCVVAYDISPQSSYYILLPGLLADPYAPRVLLNVP